MEHYTIISGTYEADEGYVFHNKINGAICGGMHLADGDSIENYEIIERPAEPVIEDIPDDEEVSDTDALNEILGVLNSEA